MHVERRCRALTALLGMHNRAANMTAAAYGAGDAPHSHDSYQLGRDEALPVTSAESAPSGHHQSSGIVRRVLAFGGGLAALGLLATATSGGGGVLARSQLSAQAGPPTTTSGPGAGKRGGGGGGRTHARTLRPCFSRVRDQPYPWGNSLSHQESPLPPHFTPLPLFPAPPSPMRS